MSLRNDSNLLLNLLRSTTPETGPVVFAHRGDSYRAPENTLIGCWMAWRSGAPAIEFDVRLTRDGVPVVIHDSSLIRTTNVTTVFAGDPRARFDYPVELFDWSELESLDAGEWFLRPNGGARSAAGFGSTGLLDRLIVTLGSHGSIRISKLNEILQFTILENWLANVEIKSGHVGQLALTDAIVQVIQELECEERVLVSSFDHAEVEHVARRTQKVATGVLVTTPLAHPTRYIRDVVGADAYHVNGGCLGMQSVGYLVGPSSQRLRRATVDECRAAGVPVCVYTINDKAAFNQLAEIGVAGVFTDDPSGMIDPSLARTVQPRPDGRQ